MVYRETHTRSGMILLVVVAFLALGLSVGIAFVFFAHQQAISMRIYREAADGGRGARLGVTSRGNGDESPPPSFDIANSALGISSMMPRMTRAASGTDYVAAA